MRLHLDNPNVPLFSGGLVDAWPNWAVETMTLGRAEMALIRALDADEFAKQRKRR